MMLKVMIIPLALDDEGITLRLHSHGQLLAMLLARSLQWGGLSWRCETKLKHFTLGIGTVFYLKLGEDPTKGNQKVYARVGIEFCAQICFKYKAKAVTYLLPLTIGGVFLLLKQSQK